MSDKEFDKYFRDRLRDHSSDVPADMWQRIHPEERRRRAFLPWFWPLAGLILLTIGLYIAYRTSVSTHYPIVISTPGHHPDRSADSSLPNQSTIGAIDPRDHPGDTTASAPLLKNLHASSGSSRPHGSTHHSAGLPRSHSPAHRPAIPPRPYSPPPTDPPSAACLSTLPSLANTKSLIGSARPNPPAAPPVFNKPPDSASPSRWSVEAYSSQDWLLTQYRSFSFTTGIKLGWTFGQRFSAQTGLQYSSSHAAITGHDSTTNFSFRLSSLDIPLLLGYKTRIGAFSSSINTGLLLNVYSAPHAGSSFYIGINVPFRLDNYRSLYIEPYYRHRLSDINHRDYSPLFHNMDAIGISIGLRGARQRDRRK